MGGKPKSAFLLERPHRRLNALTGEWVFVSPQRTERPWLGRQESVVLGARAPYDQQCYLCPGNARANGERNPPYASTYVFTNDFPAFLPDGCSVSPSSGELLRAQTEEGTCRVMCYSPRHDLTLAQLRLNELQHVIQTWVEQVAELGQRWSWVQVFENKGELMGCSNPHPHGQIWASSFIPNEPAKELARQQRWIDARGTSLLLDYAAREIDTGARVVAENAHWLVVVPWWAVWPYETLLLPREPVAHLPDLNAEQKVALAEVLGRLLRGYDALFNTSFPYSFGWHGAPTGPAPERAGAQLHAHFYPPLLRSATVKKFMVGYEMLAEPQRDITPEKAAEELRAAIVTL